MRKGPPLRPAPAAAVLLALLAAGCHTDMYQQPRYDPLEASASFPDGASARRPVSGTVARGQLRDDTALYEGKTPDGEMVDTFPIAIARADLERGRQRFNIYCIPCHGYAGDGRGMIVRRGFSPPPSFHEQRLKDAPVGHFFDAITNGYGTMYSYAARVGPEDRWRIIAYIRALQLSQAATLADVPDAAKSTLEEAR